MLSDRLCCQNSRRPLSCPCQGSCPHTDKQAEFLKRTNIHVLSSHFQLSLCGQLHHSVRGEALFSEVLQIPGELYLSALFNQQWLTHVRAWRRPEKCHRSSTERMQLPPMLKIWSLVVFSFQFVNLFSLFSLPSGHTSSIAPSDF